MTTDNSSGTAFPAGEHVHREWPYRRSVARRYGLALLAVLAALSSRYLISDAINYGLVFAFFVPAAMLSVWYGGLWPGLLATVVGLLLGDYFFMPPRFALWPLGQMEMLALNVYGLTTVLCVVLCENLHHCVRRYEGALDRQRHHPADVPAPALDHGDLPPGLPSRSSWPFRRPLLARYGVALLVVALAFALRYWMFGTDHHRYPFIYFVPAAIIATWYGGMMPGLLATASGLMLGDYFFLSEHEALGSVRETERLATGMYAITTTLCVMLFENLHDRVRRIEHALEHARHLHKTQAQPGAGSASTH